jgi:hypothetical protein
MKKLTLNLTEIEIKLIKLKGQLGILRKETLLASKEVSSASMLLAETVRSGLIRIKSLL